MKRCFCMMVSAILPVFLAAAGVRAESSVWVVKGPKATVYLAGSCHLLRASDHPLPVEFDRAYAASNRLVFEAPLGEMEKPAYLQQLLLSAMYTDGSSLKAHLSPAVWTKVQKFCRERHYDCDKYQVFRPWMFSLSLTMAELTKIGADQSYGVDRVFFRRAVNDGKSVGALETLEEQMGYMTMMDSDIGDAQVSETIDELRVLKTRYADLLRAWRSGDEAGIAAFGNRELRDYPQLYSKLMSDRNQKWVKEIEREIQGQVNTMFIMGVAHLAGPDSVSDLLRQRGYQVEKMRR